MFCKQRSTEGNVFAGWHRQKRIPAGAVITAENQPETVKEKQLREENTVTAHRKEAVHPWIPQSEMKSF